MGKRSYVFVVSIAAFSMEWVAIQDLASAEPEARGTTAGLPKVADGNWPWWRGPALDGTSQGGQVVTTWSRAENVCWEAKVPGWGHSSPIVCGESVILTTADEDAHKPDSSRAGLR